MKRVKFVLCLIPGLFFSGSVFAQWGPARIIKEARDTIITISPYYYMRAISTDPFGRVHLVWMQEPIDTSGGFYSVTCYQRSTDWGSTWEAPIRLSQPNEGGDYPSVAADGLGNVHVVWTALLRTGEYWAIYRRSTDGGQTWEPETMLVYNSKSFPITPQLVADGKGTVHLVWSHPVWPAYTEVGYKRSSDGGVTWSSDTLLTNSPLMNCPVPIALDSQGNPHICWEEYGFPYPGRLWYKNSTDGGLTWNPSVLIADSDTTLPGAPNIAVDGLGRVYVFFTAYWGSKPDSTWERQIIYRVSKDTGWTFGPRTPLTVYPASPGPASVIADFNGGVHAVWGDGPGSLLFYNGSTDGGVTWRFNPPFNLTDSFQGGWPSLTTDQTGRVHLVYRSGPGGPYTSWIIYRSGYPLGVEANLKGDFGARGLARLEVYPNPVTSVAFFRVQVPSQSKASLKIYDITGRLVRVLSSNLHSLKEVVVWDGKDGWGRFVPSGVYLCRVEGGGMETRQKALVLIR